MIIEKKGEQKMTLQNKALELIMDDVIRKYGFEANESITFCTLCEQMTDKEKEKIIAKMYQDLMEN